MGRAAAPEVQPGPEEDAEEEVSARGCQFIDVKSHGEAIFSRCILIGMFWVVVSFSFAFHTFCFYVRDDRDLS